MPALCAFTDLHNISLLLYKSPNEFWFQNFPYIHNNALFSASFDPTTFYTGLFSRFCEEHKLKLDKCDIFLTGFLQPPEIGIKTTFKASLNEVLAKVEGFYPLVVNNSFICTRDFCYSASRPLFQFLHNDVNNVEEENFYANMELYSQIVPNDFSVQVDIDRNISGLLDKKAKFPRDNPIVFCGSRFAQNTFEIELDYLLMLDLMKDHGIYDLRKDQTNSLITSTLLKMTDPKIEIDFELEREATLISTTSAVECMVKTDVDTSQLVQLDKDRILVLPVAGEERVKILVKSHDINATERQVGGGRIGLVFDSRTTKDFKPQDVDIFASGIKTFKEALGK